METKDLFLQCSHTGRDDSYPPERLLATWRVAGLTWTSPTGLKYPICPQIAPSPYEEYADSVGHVTYWETRLSGSPLSSREHSLAEVYWVMLTATQQIEYIYRERGIIILDRNRGNILYNRSLQTVHHVDLEVSAKRNPNGEWTVFSDTNREVDQSKAWKFNPSAPTNSVARELRITLQTLMFLKNGFRWPEHLDGIETLKALIGYLRAQLA